MCFNVSYNKFKITLNHVIFHIYSYFKWFFSYCSVFVMFFFYCMLMSIVQDCNNFSVKHEIYCLLYQRNVCKLYWFFVSCCFFFHLIHFHLFCFNIGNALGVYIYSLIKYYLQKFFLAESFIYFSKWLSTIITRFY